MENNNAQNVTAGKPFEGGAIFRAPVGTTLPTSALEELDEGFANVGYISEDGVTNTNAPTTENIKAWGGDIVLNTVTEKPDNYGFTMIEATNIDALKSVYGEDNVTGTLETGITITANAGALPEFAWVIDMMYKGNVRHRVVIPDATCVLSSDITYADGSAVGFPVTLSAYPDENGNTHTEHIQTASTSA